MTGETLLLRQIHPSFVQAGRATSQAFRPSPKDNSLLSVYDGDQITAEDSWHHFTSLPNCSSAGVMGVTVSEFNNESLRVRPDPEPFPEHAVVDFSGLTRTEAENKSKKLKARAEARGWQYQPPSGG